MSADALITAIAGAHGQISAFAGSFAGLAFPPVSRIMMLT